MTILPLLSTHLTMQVPVSTVFGYNIQVSYETVHGFSFPLFSHIEFKTFEYS